MGRAELPVPPHFDPGRVAEVWRVPYEERAAQAERFARDHAIAPASEDEARVALLLIDCQNTFCTPGFELFVPGAPEDSRRLAEFIYRNLGRITEIIATLDTHRPAQIFHPLFFLDEDGRHPAPYTTISAQEVEQGRFRVDPALCQALGIDPSWALRHLLHYTRALEERGKYRLTIWPYHAMLGSLGHALVAAVEEAIFFHSVARRAQPDLRIKGTSPLTERYSALGPEVATGPDGEEIDRRDQELVEKLLSFDAILVAGQAKSHCVAWTVEDLLRDLGGRADRVYLLEDCASPVVVPGVVDYSQEASAAFRRFAEAGMHVVRSSQPMETWPGMAAAIAA
ncbi:MAG: isochorismatase [Thermoleophilia bacterium]